MMNLPYLLKSSTSSRFYFRIVVPQKLRYRLGQREIRRSLQTTDQRTAILRCLALADYWKSSFEELKMKYDDDPTFIGLTLKGFKTSADGFTADEINLDPDNLGEDTKALNWLREKCAQGQPNLPTQVIAQPSDKLLSVVVDQLAAERVDVGRWRPATEKEMKASYGQMIGLLGDRALETVSRQDANRLLKTLKSMPSPHGGKLSVSMINKKIGSMSSLYKYAIQNQLATFNPFKDLQQETHIRVDQERDAYTDQELLVLFEPRHFVPDKSKPSRFWIPVLMAFTGARPGELAQLTVDDIIKVDGIDCMSINENHQVKTVNALRTIPLLDRVKFLGFFRFVEERRTAIDKAKSKDRRLFSELNSDRSKPAGAVSSWWNETHQTECNVESTQTVTSGRVQRIRKVSLYSIRHNVQTIFRTAGIAETVAAEIVGHEKGKTTYGRYAKSGELKLLIEAINTLQYIGVLNHVRSWPK